MSPESERISSHVSSQTSGRFSNQNSSQKFSVVLPLSDATEEQENNGIILGQELWACYVICGAPIMGYPDAEAEFSQIQAVFNKNPYVAGWWGRLYPGNGKRMEYDYDLDLLKDAAEVFEQQCAGNVVEGPGESDEERLCNSVLGGCVADKLKGGEHSTKLDAYNDCCINMMHADHDCCKLY